MKFGGYIQPASNSDRNPGCLSLLPGTAAHFCFVDSYGTQASGPWTFRALGAYSNWGPPGLGAFLNWGPPGLGPLFKLGTSGPDTPFKRESFHFGEKRNSKKILNFLLSRAGPLKRESAACFALPQNGAFSVFHGPCWGRFC